MGSREFILTFFYIIKLKEKFYEKKTIFTIFRLITKN